MHAATSEFLLFIDDDDVVLADHMRPHIQLMRQRPELMAVVGQVQNTSFDLGESGEPWPADLPRHGNLFRSFFSYYPQCGATVCRTSVRETVGEQDPALFGDQDWDWHLRLAQRHPVGFVQVSCLLFRQRPPSAGQESGEWRRLGDHRRTLWRNARRAGWREMPPWALAAVALKQRGGYTAAFIDYAKTHARARNRRGAYRAFARAIVASPPHAAASVVRDRNLRRALLGTLKPGSVPWTHRRSTPPLADGQRIVDEPPGVAK
jgi:hypothetical protein